jgi:S1-C subfamily serine protease
MSAPEQVAAGPRGAFQPRRPVMIGAVAVLLIVTALLFYHWGSAGPSGALPSATPSASPSASKQPTTADIYTAVAPSVVEIAATLAEGGGELTGTGVIVNADGTILTALHVVKGAAAIQVTFADGSTSPATVTAADPAMDIATLGPATLPSILVPAVLGNPGKLAVGQSVVAIGNPLGLTRTTTTGVVSGLSRVAREPDGTNLSGLIQFDAAVNPGSSGGPLLDARGQTVGIVVALANPSSAGTFIGIGFAVPITAAVSAGGGDRAPQQ